jgi:DNA-binding response OmpR family regulator
MVKLLIIEDDEAAAGSLKRGLVEAGYAVELVHDGERGLQQAQAGDHDLWVIDIMLPGRDGLSVLKTLRDQGRRPRQGGRPGRRLACRRG